MKKGLDAELDRKLLAHRKRKTLTVAAAVILLLAVFVLLQVKDRLKVYHTVTEEWTVEQPAVLSADYAMLDGNVLRYSKEGAALIGKNGKQLWNYSYTMETPRLVRLEEYGALADLAGTTAVIFSEKGVSGVVNTTEPIHNASVSAKGVLALVLDSGSSDRIAFYAKDGTPLDISVNLAMSVSGYPLALALSPDGTGLIVSTATSTSGALRSQIVFYNFAVGKGETNRIVGYYEYENVLFPEICYLDEGRAAAVGDDRLVFFDLDNEKKPERLKEVMFDSQLQNISFGFGSAAAVMPEAGGSNSLLTVYDRNGEKEFSAELNEVCRKVEIGEQNVLMVSDTGIRLWSRSGHERFSGALPTAGQAVFTTGAQKLLQFDGNALISYRLK